MNNYRQITFRYLKQNKKRTILTIIGIVLAVSLFSAIGTFTLSFQHNAMEVEKRISGNYEVEYSGLNEKQVNSLRNNFKFSNYAITEKYEASECLDTEKDTLLDLTFGDENYYRDVKIFDMVEGSIPKASNEIILERKTIRRLNKKIGDIVKVKVGEKEKTYKISGFYRPNTEISDDKYFGYGFFNEDLNSNSKYNILVNLKDKKDIYKSGREIGESLNLSEKQINFNQGLLNAMMQSKNSLLDNSFTQLALIVIVIIIISTVAVIYNSFNISVAERIRQFGILRSIGASPSKIRAMVFTEGIIMYLISLPIGILLGYVGLWVVVKILLYYQSSGLNQYDINILSIQFHPEIILLCSILAFITVFLAIIMPMITASRISPIDAIRDSVKFKKEKIKRRKARLTKLLFGIEGQIAYKNIRRNNMRFLITVLSLSVSFIMFVTITSIIISQKGFINSIEKGKPYEAELWSRNNEKGINENELKEIKDSNYVSNIYAFGNVEYPTFIENKYVNNKFLKDYSKYSNTHLDEIKIGDYDYIESLNGEIEGLNEISLKALEKHVVDGKIDMKALKEGGVIILDTNRVHIGDKIVENRFTNYKIGDTIKIPNLSKYYTEKAKGLFGDDWARVKKKAIKCFEDGDYIDAKIVAIIDKSPFSLDTNAIDRINFIFDNEYFEKNFFKIPLEKIGLGLKEDNENTNKFFDNFSEENNLLYINFQKNAQEEAAFTTIMYTFIYGFIIIVSLIAIVNIINTITMGLLLRRKEFATLSAIGMTKRQLSKMVLLEGVIYGTIVSIIGSIVSYGIFMWGQRTTSQVMEFTYSHLSIALVFVIGIVGIIALTLIASLIPLRKFKKMNIIESIKEEE